MAGPTPEGGQMYEMPTIRPRDERPLSILNQARPNWHAHKAGEMRDEIPRNEKAVWSPHLRPLRYADKAHREAAALEFVETGNHAAIVDAGRIGVGAFGRIKAGNSSVHVTYKAMLES
jgi:hypothetical protein